MRLNDDQKRRVRELAVDDGRRCECGGEFIEVGDAHQIMGSRRFYVPIGCEKRDSTMQIYLEGERAEYLGLIGPEAERRSWNPKARSEGHDPVERRAQLAAVAGHLDDAIRALDAARDAAHHYSPEPDDPGRFLHLDGTYVDAYISGALDRARKAFDEAERERDSL